jgi:hypothetical protein
MEAEAVMEAVATAAAQMEAAAAIAQAAMTARQPPRLLMPRLRLPILGLCLIRPLLRLIRLL